MTKTICRNCKKEFEVKEGEMIVCPYCGYKIPYKDPTGKIPVTTTEE